MALAQLLQGLCSDSQWKYAVLWTIKSESHGILTWSDGFVNKMTKDPHVGDVDDSHTDSKYHILSSAWCNNGQYQSCAVCPIEAALLSMSSHSYSLGEEIIGKVAFTGQHFWISANELCSTFMFKYSEDWQLQFAAGIKTILLVPVVHHGVLQLGSLDLVLENSAFVAQIKDMFYRLYNISIPCSSSGTLFDYSNTSRQLTTTLSMDPRDIMSHDLFDLINSSTQLLTTDLLSLPHVVDGSDIPMLEDIIIANTSDTSITVFPNGALDANESDLWTNVHGEQSELTHCNTVLEPGMTNLFFLDKLTNHNSKANCRSVIHIEDPEYDDVYGFTLTDIAHDYQQHNQSKAIILNDDVGTLNTSVHSEWHKDIEIVSREEHEDLMWDSALKLPESTSHALLQTDVNDTHFYSLLESRNYAELLLDAIVGHVAYPSNDESSLSNDSPVSCATQIQNENHALKLDGSVPFGQEFSPISVDEGFMSSVVINSSPTCFNKPTSEESMDDMIEEVHRPNSAEIKKRSRNNVRRPRPRDRQLIQDRMKDLRELIPNTSECSIDALLDKTITHMLFLQSISEKAEKIQNKVRKEHTCDKTKMQLESCPLRVEELDQPGHLLIEILCKEYGVFLEIAHVFKVLQLKILKGVLERRSDELWARYIIEASEGFNQMQILCPLMHMLQRS